MHYLRLVGALGILVIGLASLSEFGCSTSGDIKAPPGTTSTKSSTGGVMFGVGGTTSQDTAAGGTMPGTGGVMAATGGVVSCSDPEIVCNNACFDPATAHDHCGDCKTACDATEICLEGICGCPLSNPDGDAGAITDYEYCGVTCADLLSDKTNCGSCNKVCAFQRCIGGKCGCAATDIICGTNKECFDPLTDRNNCGTCGTKCGTYEDCEQGQCVQSCESHGATDCGGTCFDLMNNSAGGVIANCGECGHACPGDKFECKAGQCVCRAAATLATAMHCVDNSVSPPADLCVDTAKDTRFCGNCQTACEAGKSCIDSQCTCSSTSLQCSDGCHDGTSDSKNCGGCGQACGAGFHCASSTCVCNTGLDLCSGSCANYQTDSANCGGCGNNCGAGQNCTAGKCQCDAGQDLCGGNCYDLLTEKTHCGTCETACSSSQTCVAGACACGDGLLACGQECLDGQNDAKNCGACGKTCTPTQMCQGGTCKTSVVEIRTKSATDNKTQLALYINVCNASSAALSLTGYSVKYWFTSDGTQGAQTCEIDSDPFSVKPTLTVTSLDLADFRVKADTVLVAKFGGGSLAAGACTGDIQLRIHPVDYSGPTAYGAQTGDYSYLASPTTSAANQNATAYNDKGLLIWGLEPALAP